MARVLLIRQGHVPYDPRVGRELEALLGAGHEVDVISKRAAGLPRFERSPNLTIRRLPTFEVPIGAPGYLLRYLLFMVMATVLAASLQLRRRYDLVQVHSLPDILVFAAVVPKLMGARVVLDLMETMPEFFASRFGVPVDHWGVRWVAVIEQRAIRFADEVLTCTEQMREAFVHRGARPAKITVVLNSASEAVFDPFRFPPRDREPGHFVLVCHGTIEERYGLDTLVLAMAQLRDEIPELRLNVYGNGSYRAQVQDLVRRQGLEDRVWFSRGFVPIDEMVAGVADADVGIVAMKRDVFRDLTHCNKMFDFIAMRRPQIVSRTAAVEAYFDDGCFEMFTAGDVDDLARAIRVLHADPDRCRRQVAYATAVNEPYRWPRQRQVYLRAVGRALGRAGSPPAAAGPPPGAQEVRNRSA